MDVSETTKTFLENLQRQDLATLIGVSRVEIAEWGSGDDWWPDKVVVVSVAAPGPIDEALVELPDFDRKRIAEAAASATPLSAPADIEIVRSKAEPVGGAPALLAELFIQRSTMIAVATGQTRIQDVDDYYVARQSRIRSMTPSSVH